MGKTRRRQEAAAANGASCQRPPRDACRQAGFRLTRPSEVVRRPGEKMGHETTGEGEPGGVSPGANRPRASRACGKVGRSVWVGGRRAARSLRRSHAPRPFDQRRLPRFDERSDVLARFHERLASVLTSGRSLPLRDPLRGRQLGRPDADVMRLLAPGRPRSLSLLSRNFGKGSGLCAGLEEARGRRW